MFYSWCFFFQCSSVPWCENLLKKTLLVPLHSKKLEETEEIPKLQ